MLPQMPDFMDAVTRTSATAKVSEGVLHLVTLPFIRFVRMHEAFKKLCELSIVDGDPLARFEIVCIMFDAGLTENELQLMSEEDWPVVLATILEMNKYPPKLAWQIEEPGKALRQQREFTKKLSSDYPGQAVADMVTQLATTFGWSAQHIMYELTYYEVVCFMQEALIIEHDKRKFAYMIASDVGLKKVGDKFIKEPYPDLPWMTTTIEKPKVAPKPTPAKYRPDGVIIDFSQYAKTGRVMQYEIPSTKDDAKEDVA